MRFRTRFVELAKGLVVVTFVLKRSVYVKGT